MNKLITTDTGGYPFVLDDLRFMDESYREGIKGLFYNLINPTLANDGFLIDNELVYINASNSWTFPETFCYLNGEIYLIPETVLTSSSVSGKVYVLEENITYSGTAPGLKTFQDAGTHETYQIRKAKLTQKLTSALTPTDVVVLRGYSILSVNNWKKEDVNSYTWRLSNLIGLNDTKVRVSTIEDTLNEQNLNVPEWNEISDKTTIPTSLFRNSSSTPSLTGNVAFTTADMDEVNSHVKCKIIGKTLFCDFNLKSIVLPTYATAPVSSFILKLDNIPGVSIGEILKFSNVGRADVDHLNALAGALTIENHDLINDAIIMTIDAPHGTSKASFNREYEFASAGSLQVQATAVTTHVMTWTLKGSFTAQLL